MRSSASRQLTSFLQPFQRIMKEAFPLRRGAAQGMNISNEVGFMPWLHIVLASIEAIAFSSSALLWWKASMIRVPIVEATSSGIDQVATLSQSVVEASRWNCRAAIAAAVGASVHILGAVF